MQEKLRYMEYIYSIYKEFEKVKVVALNGNYQYTTAYMQKVFGSAISISNLNYLMRDFGVNQTGDEQTDLQALYSAMRSYYANNTEVTSAMAGSNQMSQTNRPWEVLMQQVGLTPVGDVQIDYAKFQDAVKLMISQAVRPEEKQYFLGLLAQGQSVFNVRISAQPTPAPSVSGADILANMNRAFMLGGK